MWWWSSALCDSYQWLVLQHYYIHIATFLTASPTMIASVCKTYKILVLKRTSASRCTICLNPSANSLSAVKQDVRVGPTFNVAQVSFRVHYTLRFRWWADEQGTALQAVLFCCRHHLLLLSLENKENLCRYMHVSYNDRQQFLAYGQQEMHCSRLCVITIRATKFYSSRP